VLGLFWVTVVPCTFSVATLADDDDAEPGLGVIGWNKLRGEVRLCEEEEGEESFNQT
jgi:hypothetical protein